MLAGGDLEALVFTPLHIQLQLKIQTQTQIQIQIQNSQPAQLKMYCDQFRGSVVAGGDLEAIIQTRFFTSGAYLIFVIFCTPPRFLACKLYAELRNVNSFTQSKILELNFTPRKARK